MVRSKATPSCKGRGLGNHSPSLPFPWMVEDATSPPSLSNEKINHNTPLILHHLDISPDSGTHTQPRFFDSPLTNRLSDYKSGVPPTHHLNSMRPKSLCSLVALFGFFFAAAGGAGVRRGVGAVPRPPGWHNVVHTRNIQIKTHTFDEDGMLLDFWGGWREAMGYCFEATRNLVRQKKPGGGGGKAPPHPARKDGI